MAVQISGNDITVPRDGTFSRNVSIAGTLTYEDVTNVDSIGLVTATTGIEIGARPGVAASISIDGNMIVSGISTFGGDVQVPDKIIHSGDTNTAIRFPSADTITFETAGSERLRISSNGNLGIGAAPTAGFKLSITDAGNPTVRIEDTDASNSIFDLGQNNGEAQLIARGPSSANGTFVFYQHDGSTLSIAAKIDTAGRLMLGTTTEGYSSADDLTVSTSGTTGITIRSGTSNTGTLAFSDGTSGADEYRGYIQYEHQNDALAFGSNGTEKFRISSTGNVSINTTNVTEGVLQVNGDISAGILHGGRMYGLLAKRKFDGNNSLAGFAMEYASGYESPYIVAYNNTSSPSANNITFGSLTTSDRNLNTGLTKLVEINANSGNTTLKTGNLVIGTSGRGIDFSNAGGSNAGSSSAILDDYEEGSFTAILRSNSNTANTGYNYDTSNNFTSYYTKIGNIVYVSISLSNLHTSPDHRNHQLIRVEGLPFTTARRCGINVVDGRGIYPRWSSDSQTTNAATWTPWADGSTTMFYLQLYMHYTPYTAWGTVANSTSSQRLHLAGCYPVA